MLFLFRNIVFKVNDIVGKWMRDRYVSFLDENDEKLYVIIVERVC